MGLDTYAMQRGADGDWEVAPDEPFDGIQLCGGICSSGQDSSSIRGKVYDLVVRAATGESLYQERIEPERVAEMARRLRTTVDAAKREGPRPGARGLEILEVASHEINPDEAEGLASWFEVCAERGYAVEGWW
jgi:hypothetical protein